MALTRASDRIEAARKALTEYNATARRYRTEGVDDIIDYENAADGLAAALEALITPPDVGESVEQITEGLNI